MQVFRVNVAIGTTCSASKTICNIHAKFLGALLNREETSGGTTRTLASTRSKALKAFRRFRCPL